MKLNNTNFNFHVIRDEVWMENVLLMLQRHFNFVTISDLEDFYYHGKSLKNACHLTVDDGDISLYTKLFPLIKKYRIPISIYVSPLTVKTGSNFWFQEIEGFNYRDFFEFCISKANLEIDYISKDQLYAFIKSLKINEISQLINSYKETYKIPDKKRMSMGLDQLLELKESGLVTIGAHTMNHPILKNEDDLTARREILLSIEELRDMLHDDVKCFAYPNGIPHFDFGLREMEILKDAKINLAFSTEGKSFSQKDHPLSIPRRGFTKGGMPFLNSKLFLADYWDVIKKIFKGKQEMDFRRN